MTKVLLKSPPVLFVNLSSSEINEVHVSFPVGRNTTPLKTQKRRKDLEVVFHFQWNRETSTGLLSAVPLKSRGAEGRVFPPG